MTTGDPYPSPSDISYGVSSRWCQEHGHTGLLVGSVCGICDHLVASDPRFAAVLGTEHNADGSRRERAADRSAPGGRAEREALSRTRPPLKVVIYLEYCGAGT